MKKFLLAPDSFKGTMNSIEVCRIMEKAIKKSYPDSKIQKVPISDGGEGTVDCLIEALGGEKIFTTVKGPYMNDMESFYGMLPDGRTAVIEMAACAGLPLVGEDKRVSEATTYGVGQLILKSIENGAKNIIVGLGGSATNDLGAGMAAALGVNFIREDGENFIPVGKNLSKIVRIDISGLKEKLKGIKVTAICDITNPLYGKNGAAYVFAPQKGADEEMVKFLDMQLRSAAKVINRELNIDISNMPCAGAAGGMGGGMIAFLDAKIKKGIDTILNTVDFDSLLMDTDVVITGEGTLNSQSFDGKAVVGIAERAKKYSVPVIAVVGYMDEEEKKAKAHGISAVFAINKDLRPFDEIKANAKKDLYAAMLKMLNHIGKYIN